MKEGILRGGPGVVVVEGETINAGRHNSVLLRIEKKEEAELSVNTKKENDRLIYKEKTILDEAEYHSWSPMLSITPEARHPPRHGGRWRPTGAVSHRHHGREPSALVYRL